MRPEMLGRLSVAFLLAATPALANDPAAGTAQADAPAPGYKIKKVCRTVEVSGSFIPRTSCVTKKIPIKKPAPETQDAANPQSGAADGAADKE
jgi:hypothetical protein